MKKNKKTKTCRVAKWPQKAFKTIVLILPERWVEIAFGQLQHTDTDTQCRNAAVPVFLDAILWDWSIVLLTAAFKHHCIFETGFWSSFTRIIWIQAWGIQKYDKVDLCSTAYIITSKSFFTLCGNSDFLPAKFSDCLNTLLYTLILKVQDICQAK